MQVCPPHYHQGTHHHNMYDQAPHHRACKQVTKCCHMCVCAFIMPSNHMGFTNFTRASRYSSGVPSIHGLLHHTKDMFIGSIACQGPYEVIIIIQELHDPDKGCKVIKSPSVGPRTSSGLLHQARGFNHLNHTGRPLEVKISPVGFPDLLLGYHDTIRA